MLFSFQRAKWYIVNVCDDLSLTLGGMLRRIRGHPLSLFFNCVIKKGNSVRIKVSFCWRKIPVQGPCYSILLHAVLSIVNLWRIFGIHTCVSVFREFLTLFDAIWQRYIVKLTPIKLNNYYTLVLESSIQIITFLVFQQQMTNTIPKTTMIYECRLYIKYYSLMVIYIVFISFHSICTFMHLAYVPVLLHLIRQW